MTQLHELTRSRRVAFFGRMWVCGLIGLWSCSSIVAEEAQSAGKTRAVQYDRDVRPILSAHCYQCHGPDTQTREADLRLDTREGLYRTLEKGRHVVVPSDLTQSELYRRVASTDPMQQMPPPEAGKPLSAQQVEVLRLWIEQGAVWQRRWSYERIARPPVPVTNSDWPENPIDAFLQKRWSDAGVTPAATSDMSTLKRRLSFDLTGLPPIDDHADAVDAITDQSTYVQFVEQLLASPRFGERMAVYWLDLVRYADSCGYHSDVEQQVSAYRDYVIHAFNRNERFDQFTREQLAGDLLDQPTLDQQIATGFNRLSKTTEEGGAQEGEYLAKAFADRVRTVSGTWLAATLGCAECHDHKYDPLSTRDFYAFGAFFADVKERGVYPGQRNHEPDLALPTPAQTELLESLGAELAKAREQLQNVGTQDSATKETLEKGIKQLEQKNKDLQSRVRTTLVTVSVTPREIRILPRGDWLTSSGAVVEPAVPAIFQTSNPAERRLTRLDLAEWLVHRDNPLTARVFVNRIWKLFFGTGLSKSLDDLGSQGETPVHPELLDWLSAEFIESGWDIKHLVRLMVTSRAYRLSSVPTAELVRIDPQNRLHARQSRWRLDAEFLRDNALLVSGLLADQLGGPSVKPYQPATYWEFLNFPKRTWNASTGADQYRRGLYTHWQRTFPHPSMLAFDAPSREECTAARAVSNTPKSALALLNDPTYVEAARLFAERILSQGGDGDGAKLAWAWRTALTRSADENELRLLSELLRSNREQYQSSADAAEALQTVGQAPAAQGAESQQELAAWTAVARAILNLHEFTTRN